MKLRVSGYSCSNVRQFLHILKTNNQESSRQFCLLLYHSIQWQFFSRNKPQLIYLESDLALVQEALIMQKNTCSNELNTCLAIQIGICMDLWPLVQHLFKQRLDQRTPAARHVAGLMALRVYSAEMERGDFPVQQRVEGCPPSHWAFLGDTWW